MNWNLIKLALFILPKLDANVKDIEVTLICVVIFEYHNVLGTARAS
jgi:hypothetical protein